MLAAQSWSAFLKTTSDESKNPNVDFRKLAHAAEACGFHLKVLHSPKPVRLTWAENLKYVLQFQKRSKGELKSSMLMSAIIALWVGRRHLFSLIFSGLCGCFCKKRTKKPDENRTRSLIIWLNNNHNKCLYIWLFNCKAPKELQHITLKIVCCGILDISFLLWGSRRNLASLIGDDKLEASHTWRDWHIMWRTAVRPHMLCWQIREPCTQLYINTSSRCTFKTEVCVCVCVYHFAGVAALAWFQAAQAQLY